MSHMDSFTVSPHVGLLGCCSNLEALVGESSPGTTLCMQVRHFGGSCLCAMALKLSAGLIATVLIGPHVLQHLLLHLSSEPSAARSCPRR